MPIDCANSSVISDQICGKIVVCLRDTSGSAYFGSHGTGPFGQGSSPDSFFKDYAEGAPFEAGIGNVQCFTLSYTPPTGGATTDTITIQSTDTNNQNDAPPCVFTFNVPTPCTGGNAPTCPDPSENISYDINTTTTGISRDIVGNLGFDTGCTVIAASSTGLTVIGAGTSITISDAAINAAGVGSYVVNYTVDCGADGNVSCSFTVNVTDSTAGLTCPNGANSSFNYSLNDTTDLNITLADLGLDNTCTIDTVASATLSTSIINAGSTITIPQASLAAAGAGTNTVNYTITCNGQTISCSLSVVITAAGVQCPNCANVMVDWNGSAINTGSTQSVACGAAAVPFTLTLPNPADVSLDYFFPSSSAGTIDFVSSTGIVNGFQEQTWEFTPKTSGCAESMDIILNWSSVGNQAGCASCPLFTIDVGACADCGGGLCSSAVLSCQINPASPAAGEQFTLTALTGCDCTGCQVTWRASVDNPSTITLDSNIGSTVTGTMPTDAVDGVYTFYPDCCGCE